MNNRAQFPNSVWNGISPSRVDAPHVTREPSNQDWDQIVAELMATQQYVLTLDPGSGGAITPSQLGIGTADSTTFLRGDSTWHPISVTFSDITGSIAMSQLGSGTADNTSYLRGDGTWQLLSGITSSLNASNLSTGTVSVSRLGSGSPSSSNFLRGDGSWQLIDLSSLNANNLTSGQVATARLGSGTANSSSYLRGDSTWQLISGIISSLPVANLSGTIPTINLGTGTADSTTFLRGDNTWQTVSGGTPSLTDLGTGTPSSANFLRGDGTWNAADLSALNASSLTSGLVATLRLGSGTANSGSYLRGDSTWQLLTDIISSVPGSNITGVVPTAHLGTGTADSTTYLRGDGSWADPVSVLNASNLSSGTVATARLGSGTADTTTYLRGDGSWTTILNQTSADARYAQLSNNLSDLASASTARTNLGTNNASNLSSGTVATARLGSGTADTTTYLRGDGSWSTVFTQTSADARYAQLSNNLSDVNASTARTNLGTNNASNLSSGTVATARLGSGTADSTTYLRGDNTWTTIFTQTLADARYAQLSNNLSDVNASTARTNLGTNNASNLSSGTVATARLGSGTTDSTTYLRGDNTFQALASIPYDPTLSGLSATTLKTALDEINSNLAVFGGSVNRLVSGGGVSWVSGYIFSVSAATYYINGILYHSIAQNVTLSAADATLGRIDTLVLNTSGTFVSITGTPLALPTEPTVDSQTQLQLTNVTVDAASSTPSTIANTLIYSENAGNPTEWAATTSGSGLVVNSTNNPYLGSVDIEATSVASNSYIQLQAVSSIDISTQNYLVFYIRSKASWSAKSLVLGFYLNGVLKGSTVSLKDGVFGFSSSTTNTYQQIVIPVSSFAVPAGVLVNQLRSTIIGTGGSIGFYLDYFNLQTNTSGTSSSWLNQTQGDARYLQRGNNLSDVIAATARTNLGILTQDRPIILGTSGTPVTGALTVKRYVKYACSLVDIQGVLGTAPTGSAFTVDVEYSADGSTGWTALTTSGNRLSIAVGSYTGNTSTFSTSTLAAGSYLRLNYIAINAAADPVITLTTVRTS